MARLSYAFSNFTAGELSPRLDGRFDLTKYRNGCSTLENFVIHPHGGATRRPGSHYVAEVKTSSASTRLIPFEFSTEQTYVIEAGNQYFRFYKDNGQIVSGGSAYEISTPYSTADLFELRFAQSADVMYIVHPSYAPRKLTRTGHTAWTLTEADFEFGPFLDENLTSTTILASGRSGSVTLTASSSIFVSTDVGRLVKIYDGYAKITNFSSGTSVTATVQDNLAGDAELLPSYTATSISFKEGDPSATGNQHNDRIVDINKNFVNQGFKENQKITVSGTASNNGTYLIVSVTADTILIAPSDDLTDEVAGGSFTIVGTLEATDKWSLGAFSETTGYPGAICFFEERLVLGGTTAQPQTIFFSESGGFEQFADGAEDADAMVYTIASDQVNVIRYLAPGRALLVGTSGGEFVASSGSTSEPITPTTIQINRQTKYGTSNVDPVSTGNVVLFLQRAKRKIRELVYNYDVDGYIAPDMTLLAEHVSEGGFVQLDVQQEPDNVIWAVRADGVLCGMTYRREEEVVAWHRHVFGGTDAAVESIAVIPGDLDEDQVWVIVKRTINGATKRYVEYLTPQDFGSDTTDAFYVDSGLTYDGSPATTITGLGHLEGETVTILADGAAHANKTVSSGSITLDRSASKVHVGLGYTSTLRTMRIEGGALDGVSQGKVKRIHDVTIRLYRTVGAKVGASAATADLIPFRSSADPMDTALSLFTGDKTIEFENGYDTDGFLTVVQDQPLPLTLLGIYARLEVFDR